MPPFRVRLADEPSYISLQNNPYSVRQMVGFLPRAGVLRLPPALRDVARVRPDAPQGGVQVRVPTAHGQMPLGKGPYAAGETGRFPQNFSCIKTS